MIFFDKETCGLTGPTVLDQWAEDDGPVHIHSVWEVPVRDTLQLYERYVDSECCAFNMTFDWFHLVKDYNILRLAADCSKPPIVAEYIANQQRAVDEAVCLKPRGALDLYLFALQGPMQNLMARDSMKIRKVPTQCAEALARHLDKYIDIDEIFFAKKTDKTKRWQCFPWIDPDTKEEDERFKDVILSFASAAGLKPMVGHIFGLDTVDYPIPDHLKVKDDNIEWYPFHHKARWDIKIRAVVKFWRENQLALRYAREDVEHLQRLYTHFGSPPCDDENSYLVPQVAATRWKGFALDQNQLDKAEEHFDALKDMAPRSPAEALGRLHAKMSAIERLAVKDTSGATLEAVSDWPDHPAAKLAHDIHAARSAATMVNLVRKLREAGRSHPDFRIIGTRSSRMAGTGGINMTGIPATEWVRKAYLLADELERLDGGDFSGYEVSIAAAVYGDPRLIAELKSGQKLHGMFGALAYDESYEDVMATKLEGQEGMYGKAKSGVFALFYGAMEWKLAQTLGIDVERAADLVKQWEARYPRWAESRKRTFMKFCSMRQPGGIGTRVYWHEPADYCETMLGFKRYFTLENRICKALFELGQRVPADLRQLGTMFRVKRRDRYQTGLGATQSALFGAAFQIQAQNMRSAGNHEIQSMGGQCTKKVQGRLWDQQPQGIHPFRIRLLQVHDEIEAIHDGTVDTQAVVDSAIDELREYIPLLEMEWRTGLTSWADVK